MSLMKTTNSVGDITPPWGDTFPDCDGVAQASIQFDPVSFVAEEALD